MSFPVPVLEESHVPPPPALPAPPLLPPLCRYGSRGRAQGPVAKGLPAPLKGKRPLQQPSQQQHPCFSSSSSRISRRHTNSSSSTSSISSSRPAQWCAAGGPRARGRLPQWRRTPGTRVSSGDACPGYAGGSAGAAGLPPRGPAPWHSSSGLSRKSRSPSRACSTSNNSSSSSKGAAGRSRGGQQASRGPQGGCIAGEAAWVCQTPVRGRGRGRKPPVHRGGPGAGPIRGTSQAAASGAGAGTGAGAAAGTPGRAPSRRPRRAPRAPEGEDGRGRLGWGGAGWGGRGWGDGVGRGAGGEGGRGGVGQGLELGGLERTPSGEMGVGDLAFPSWPPRTSTG